MVKKPVDLYEIACAHLRYSDGTIFDNRADRPKSPFETELRAGKRVPYFTLKSEYTVDCDLRRVKKAFPISVGAWFQDLPIYVKQTLGTREFTKHVCALAATSCFHRMKGKHKHDCSACQNALLSTERDYDNFMSIIGHFYDSEWNFSSVSEMDDGKWITYVIDLVLIEHGQNSLNDIQEALHPHSNSSQDSVESGKLSISGNFPWLQI